jgi:hypothetical protein
MKRRIHVFWGFLLLILSISIMAPHFTAINALAIETSYGSFDIRSTTKFKYQSADNPTDKMLADDDNDLDISELLGIDADFKKMGFTLSFLGKYARDLDGTPEGSVFQDYLDGTSDNDHRLDIYYAYIEKKDIVNNVDLRLGRQYVYAGSETAHFDGLWLKANSLFKDRISLEAYAGAVVQMYSDLDQDGVGGLNLELRPSKYLTAYLNTLFYEQNYFDASIYYRPNEHIKTSAKTSFIDENARDLGADIITTIPKTHTEVLLSVYRHFDVDEQDDFLYDYTFSIEDTLKEDIRRLYLGRELGYTEATLSITQPIPTQEGLSVFARYTNRQLSDNSDEDLYNTDFDRWTLGFTMDDWWVFHGTHLSLGYSYWDESRDLIYEANSLSYFGDITQKITGKFSIGAGFYYKEEDINSLIEGEAAKHYYGSLKYKLDKKKWAELKYEYEEDDYYKEYGIDSLNAITATIYCNF